MEDTPAYYDNQVLSQAEASAEDMQAGAKALPFYAPHPPSNTGCTSIPSNQDNKTFLIKQFFTFDWYQATLEQEVEPVQALRWGQFLGDSVPVKPRNSYEYCHDFSQAMVFHGGESGKFGIHVKISGGDACPAIVESFRAEFPSHRPSRVDVFVDFRGEKAYNEIRSILKSASRKFEIPSQEIANPLTPDGSWPERGRTLYVNPRQKGKEAPVYMCRLYEKGHQMRALKHIPDAPLDWVRLEFEMHPPKHTRHQLADMSPDDVAHSSRWWRYVVKRLGTISAQRVMMSTRRIKPEVVSSLENMCAQYSGVIAEAKRDQWMNKDEYMQAMEDLWNRECFGGLPASIRRNYIFQA
jgi:hypothetical protein